MRKARRPVSMAVRTIIRSRRQASFMSLFVALVFGNSKPTSKPVAPGCLTVSDSLSASVPMEIHWRPEPRVRTAQLWVLTVIKTIIQYYHQGLCISTELV